jgi:hypothetical protein
MRPVVAGGISVVVVAAAVCGVAWCDVAVPLPGLGGTA